MELQNSLAQAATHGLAPFQVPGLPETVYTSYSTYGNLYSDEVPVIALHGGPGACHGYMLPMLDLSVPMIFYDQIGCGKSTHLPEKNGDEDFWSIDLFMDELDNLIDYLGLGSQPVDIIGHSWGGMLAAEWAATERSANLRRLVLFSAPADSQTLVEGMVDLIEDLPEELQKAIKDAEESGNYTSPGYLAAIDEFYQRHLSISRPYPAPEMESAFKCFAEDETVYGTMLGPSEFTVIGSLRDWSVVSKINKIKVPTLLINGEKDEIRNSAMQPFFDCLDKVRWVTVDGSAHMVHLDQRERFMEIVGEFLK